MDSIGNRIKHLRKQRGLTQPQLAKLLNVSPQVISNWERGYTPTIAPESIDKLASILETTSDFLLGRSTASISSSLEALEKSWPEGIKVLRRANEKLTPEKKRVILELIDTYVRTEGNHD
ncbi:helix-turn-helix domain protein [Heliomicrobium modesticaldum Ice1]|uniref:Helix-turn-helix domain protein n=1 Tax=Heliobacterium modesticaldum (strain ATCC 51547 / Ice1) TaxID=498761 RepID=B0TGX1_HELMI|nr:helix-turn-helix transcriptional regulator [Heliomicrobium modesticaldum]ABZ83296.1 helix-turn-helix domain protein [Heliomicrobium modesticaldum Ice1]